MTKKTQNKLRKALLLVCSAMLLVSITIGATVAFLQDVTTAVTNTFTVGSVSLENGLDEAKVDLYGVPVEDAARVTENTYKLIPGHTYTKDPTVHVAAGSEECYLFVTVNNDIVEIEDATTIADQMTAKGWVELEGNVYYYNTTVDAREEKKDVIVFESFKIKGDADVSTYAGKTVTIQAYAVQADGFTDAAAAWEATFGANNG